MIQLSAVNLPNSDWQMQLKQGFSSAASLLDYLNIDNAAYNVDSHRQFPTRVPMSFAQRMAKGDINDPLLKQVLPIDEEQLSHPDFIQDPVGDLQAIATKGIIHKYHGRALIVAAGSCAVNCRYCFRRNFPYDDHALSKQDRLNAIQHIEQDNSISEVIFSGGDPLMLNDRLLAQWLTPLSHIPHIKRIRIHSRLPVVLPARITHEMIELFLATGKQLCMVIHANHPNELDRDVETVVKLMRENGITVLNQSVLLKGINNCSATLTELSEKLFAIGVLPYYIHLLDKVDGASHFLTSEQEAISIHQILQKNLPGYLVPKLVQEQAGQTGKTWINRH